MVLVNRLAKATDEVVRTYRNAKSDGVEPTSTDIFSVVRAATDRLTDAGVIVR